MAPHPTMGQEPYSCDTTQIDACASTRFMRHHACPMDNGTGSRRHLLGCPFKPPSEGHSLDHAPSRSHHPGLSAGLCCRVLFFLTGFAVFIVTPIICTDISVVKVYFCHSKAVNFAQSGCRRKQSAVRIIQIATEYQCPGNDMRTSRFLCHCEERSDAAIRIPSPSLLYDNIFM